MSEKILERIERSAGVPGLASILADRLGSSDLQSLLLEVYRRRTSRRRPATILSDYEANRFVRPSEVPSDALLEWERVALEELPSGFEAVELSPVCPAGTSSVLGGVNQNWVVSTARNTEVVSDSTNVLALECAVRRRKRLRSPSTAGDPVHLAASHRLVRAQKFEGPGFLANFRVFSLCTAGRNRPGCAFKESTIALHARFYLRLLRARLGGGVPLRFTASDFGWKRRRTDPAARIVAAIGEEFPEVECTVDRERTAGRGYYEDLCFHVWGRAGSDADLQLADGGGVRWMQELLGSSKERLVISGVGSERVLTQFAQ